MGVAGEQCTLWDCNVVFRQNESKDEKKAFGPQGLLGHVTVKELMVVIFFQVLIDARRLGLQASHASSKSIKEEGRSWCRDGMLGAMDRGFAQSTTRAMTVLLFLCTVKVRQVREAVLQSQVHSQKSSAAPHITLSSGRIIGPFWLTLIKT
jgi:hypothetical protein